MRLESAFDTKFNESTRNYTNLENNYSPKLRIFSIFFLIASRFNDAGSCIAG